MFKLSYHAITWDTWNSEPDLELIADEIKEAGFQGVEGLSIHSLEDLIEIPKIFALRGLSLVTIGGATPAKSIDYSVALGLKVIIGTSFFEIEGEKPSLQDYKEAGRRLETLARYAAKFGIDVAVHPHLGSLLETKEDLDKVFKGSKFLKLCLETGHLIAAGSDPIEVLKDYADRIALVHLKDRYRDTSTDNRYAGKFVELGRGNLGLDIKEVMKNLERIGYKGWVTVEQDRTDKTPLESAKINRDYLRSIGY